MFKYFSDAISSALGFTKTESRGTLILIFVIFATIVTTQVRVSYLKNLPVAPPDSTLVEWVNEVQASYTLKESKEKKIAKSKNVAIERRFDKTESQSVKPATLEVLEKPEKVIIKNLNYASEEDLQAVRGIGPAYASRIVKYRDMLGGFVRDGQLEEVYGLKPETIQELLKHFQIMTKPAHVDINSDSIKVLVKHPYISYDLARIIINYRKAHGNFESVDDLRKIKALDEHTFLRLKPYLE